MQELTEIKKNGLRIKNTVSSLTPEEKERIENEIVDELYKLFTGK